MLAQSISLEVIHPSGGRSTSSHLMRQAWHHLTAELAQNGLEQLLVAVQRIKAAAQLRQAMVQEAHAMAASDHRQVAWLSCCCSGTVAVAGDVVEAGEAGHLLDCAGAGGSVHGGLELC